MKKTQISTIAILTTLLTSKTLSLAPSKDNVVLLIELARHGARAPLSNLKGAQWIDDIGPGELTPVGQRQRFYLGMNTRLRYPSIFNKKLKNSEYYVRSTNTNRTVESAFSHLTSLLESYNAEDLPFGNKAEQLLPPQEIKFNLDEITFNTPLNEKFEAFPIHSALDNDYLLKIYLQGTCPKLSSKIDDTLSNYADSLTKSDIFNNFLTSVYQKLNIDEKSIKGDIFKKCFIISDYVIMDYQNSKTPILDKNDEMFIMLERCYSAYIVGQWGDDLTTKVTNSPLLREIKEIFQNKIKGGLDHKYIQYSGHDTTLSSHLKDLKILDPECLISDLKSGKISENCRNCPPVASNILWELINDNNNYFVKFSYNGVYFDYCGGGSQEEEYKCKIEDFFAKIDKVIFNDFFGFCGINKPGEKQEKKVVEDSGGIVWIFGGICAFLLVSFVFLVGVLMKLRKEYDGLVLKENGDVEVK